jgi:hypothetical protein
MKILILRPLLEKYCYYIESQPKNKTNKKQLYK